MHADHGFSFKTTHSPAAASPEVILRLRGCTVQSPEHPASPFFSGLLTLFYLALVARKVPRACWYDDLQERRSHAMDLIYYGVKYIIMKNSCSYSSSLQGISAPLWMTAHTASSTETNGGEMAAHRLRAGGLSAFGLERAWSIAPVEGTLQRVLKKIYFFCNSVPRCGADWPCRNWGSRQKREFSITAACRKRLSINTLRIFYRVQSKMPHDSQSNTRAAHHWLLMLCWAWKQQHGNNMKRPCR